MDGWMLINEGHERGMSHHDIYRPYNEVYNAIRRFIDPDYFGLMKRDDEIGEYVPGHVNGRSNPFPVTDRFGRRARRTFKKSDAICHFAAEAIDLWPKFAFMVNSPKSSTHLINFDVDGEDYAKTREIVANLYLDLFADFLVYTEKSRNRNGCYLWALIDRESDPATFNDLCNALTGALRFRYHGLGDISEEEFHHRRDQRVNYFDGIKATLHYDDRDDLTRLYESAYFDGRYNDNHRGLLATMPLSGYLNDRAEGLRQREVFLRFVRRKKKRYMNAIPETHLWDVLARLEPEKATEVQQARQQRLDSLRERGREEKGEALTPPSSSSSNNLRTSPPRTGGAEARRRLLTKAKQEPKGKNRMAFASSLYFYDFGRYAETAADLVAYYERLNLHTLDDKGNRRVQRAEEALKRHKAIPAKARVSYDPAEWLPLIDRYVTLDARKHAAVVYPYAIENEMLAALLALLTFNAFRANRIDRMHTTSQVGQERWYDGLRASGTLVCLGTKRPISTTMKQKRVDAVKLLQLSGLVVLRDSKWVYGGKDDGIGQKFGTGVHHPRHDDFVRLFGHVVDPSSLPVVVAVERAA